ncbi:hypothetical protein AB1484_33685 [Parafrankia sp. FMc6]|uniref:hypothetical protein n=1 Tax=Parafrankia soli TaxID=2599596 RepID=UPI0034D4209B
MPGNAYRLLYRDECFGTTLESSRFRWKYDIEERADDMDFHQKRNEGAGGIQAPTESGRLRRSRSSGRIASIAITIAVVSLAACDTTSTPDENSAMNPSAGITYVSASPGTDADNSEGTETYIRRFREEFPRLAQGKTDAQIIGDAEASCSDMAASRKITTPSMGERYGLGGSTADQFTLHNIALLAMSTVCGIR